MNTSRSIVDVGVAMVLKDRFSQEAGRISGSFRNMMNDMNSWGRAIQMSTSWDFGRKMLVGMAEAYKYSAGVQNEIWTAAKIAGATIEEQEKMMQLAKDVNAITPLTSSDVASGQRYLAMAGNKYDAIKEMIGPASKLASIFSMPVGQKGGVADLMTNIMSMYQMPMSNAASVTDDLFTAVTNANISLTDLAQSISYAGADMATARISLRETAAAIGVLGDMGIQGSMAGTSLANMIRYLQLSLVNQKKKGYNALQEIGLSADDFFDAKGNLINLYDIYRKFAKAAIDMPSRLETPTFFNIFGVRGNRGMLPVLRDIASGRDKMKKILDQYDKNAGQVDYLNTQRLSTPAGIIDRWQSGLENLTVTAGQALARLFNPFLEVGIKIVNVIDKISQTWAGSFALRVAATGVVVTGLVTGFRFMKGVISMMTYSQQQLNGKSSAMTAAVAATNAQFLIMEQHLVRIGNLMRHLIILQAQTQGITYAKNGTPRNSKGQWAKGPRLPAPFIAMGPGLGLNTSTAGQAATTAASTIANSTKAAFGLATVGRGILKMGGRIIGAMGGPWGMAISFGIPLLLEGVNWLTEALNKNTEAQRKKGQEKTAEFLRADNERRFFESIKQAIREGMKDSSIKINVEGMQSGGDTYISTGGKDYTGVLMGI